MSEIIRILSFLQQYGIVGALGRLKEKCYIDPYRFRSGLNRTIPVFSNKKQHPINDVIVPSNGITICYLTHFFYPSKHGGTERFVYNLARQQKLMGNFPFVLTLGNRPLYQYDRRFGSFYYREYYFDGIPVIELRHRRAPLGLYYKIVEEDDDEMKRFTRFLVRSRSLDIIHAAYPQPFAPFLFECAAMGVPFVITITDFVLLCHYATMMDRKGEFCSGSQCGRRCEQYCKTYGVQNHSLRYQTASKLLSQSSFLTAPSDFVASVMEQEFPYVDIQVVPHGIDGSFLANRQRGQTKRFVYAGTLSELKGVHLLIAAFSHLKEDCQLDIYGSGSAAYEQKLKKAADFRVTFHGDIPSQQMTNVYQGADCVVVPSIWYETYNYVLREALSCGCLVIASAIGAMPEIVINGRNGFLFCPGDEQDLEDKLNQAVHFDWSTYQKLTMPTPEQESKRYAEIYTQVHAKKN